MSVPIPSKPRVDVAIALVRRHSRWLVARRRNDVHLGGLWEFPGGKLHAGESSTEAAVRELMEECGVAADADRVLGVFTHEYDDRIVCLTAVLCRWIAGEPHPAGSEEVRWVDDDALRALEMPAMNAEIIDAALQS